MRINNDGAANKPHASQRSSGPTRVAAQASGASAAQGPSISTSSTSNLLDLVAASTDVRDQVVADVKLRVAQGEFATQQAAYQAAEAILNV